MIPRKNVEVISTQSIIIREVCIVCGWGHRSRERDGDTEGERMNVYAYLCLAVFSMSAGCGPGLDVCVEPSPFPTLPYLSTNPQMPLETGRIGGATLRSRFPEK